MPFEQTLVVTWGDLDSNGHMANTAYLNKAVDVRAAFMASLGMPMKELLRLQIGPFAMKDELAYSREFALQNEIRATLEVSGLSDDGSRWRLRNQFFRGDDLAVSLHTLGGWVDLTKRQLIAPEGLLGEIWRSLDPTDDFEVLPSLVRRSGQ